MHQIVPNSTKMCNYTCYLMTIAHIVGGWARWATRSAMELKK